MRLREYVIRYREYRKRDSDIFETSVSAYNMNEALEACREEFNNATPRYVIVEIKRL